MTQVEIELSDSICAEISYTCMLSERESDIGQLLELKAMALSSWKQITASNLSKMSEVLQALSICSA